MKLLNKSYKFNKAIYTMELNDGEKFLGETELIKRFKDTVPMVYMGFGYTVSKFENRLEIKVYTD